MTDPKTIMLVEDELSMRIGMQHTLSTAGYVVSTFEEADSALRDLQKNPCDLIISDLRLPSMSGLELLEKTHELYIDTGMILITAFPEVELAVQAMRQGAFDFICKPFSNHGLLIAVERYFHFHELKQENTRLKVSASLNDMIGGASMQAVFDRTKAVADSSVSVLILGESGTGKELVADALYHLGSRVGKPFIKINCAALPEYLLESELFGHEKGAFTGAHKRHPGKFEAANNGTLFFDEVGDMPLHMQAKLLRVLEENEITRVGGNTPVKVDVRAIFATAQNLDAAVNAGKFRLDFFYRINVVPIHLPPLRERGDDISLFINYFLHSYAKHHGKQGLRLSSQTLSALMGYDYPGNIRELKNIIQRLVLLTQDKVIRVGHLPQRMRDGILELQPPALPDELQDLAEGVRNFELHRITQALTETNGKKQHAANLLGISRKVLWKKIKELGIKL